MTAHPAMHVVTVKAPFHVRETQAELVRRASVAANDLLETTGRVLVVYGKEGASIYYDAPVRARRPVA